MKRRGLCALVALSMGFVFAVSSCGGPVVEPDYEADKGVKKMHIGAWVSPPPDKNSDGSYKYITEEQYRRVADSGIDTIYEIYGWNFDRNGTLEALRCAEKAGVNLYVRNEGIGSLKTGDDETLSDFVDQYKDAKAFTGNLVYDEPGAGKFDMLGESKKLYEKNLPGKMFYTNLFPTYSSVSQRDGRDYYQYIDEFLRKVKPQVLSYDHYPLLMDAYGKTSLTEDYLLNHEIVAAACKKAGVPFWNFMQTIAFGITNRAPESAADMRFQMAVSMAYGVRGVQHFCYWTPGQNGTEGFGAGMVDTAGNMTTIYEYAKTANLEVRKWEYVYLNFDWQGTVTNIGSLNKSGKNVAFNLLKEKLASHARISKLESERDAILGTFKDKDGNDGFMLVNYTDPFDKTSNEATVTFKDAREALVYIKGEKTRVKLDGGKYTVKLEPGEGQFIIPLK